MIYIIVGPSRAGKTTFTENTFIRGEVIETRDLIPLTETETAVLFGKYKTDDRRKGTDTTDRRDIVNYIEQVKRLNQTDKDIVLEGTRVSGKLMHELYINGFEARLIWVKCSAEKCLERNREAGNKQTTSHFVAEATKAEFAFWRYAKIFNGVIYDTEDIDNADEWENFNIDSPKVTPEMPQYWVEFTRYLQRAKEINQNEDFGVCFASIIQYPSFVKVLEKANKYRSVIDREKAVPKILSARWKKHA